MRRFADSKRKPLAWKYLTVLAVLIVWNALIMLTPFLEPSGLKSGLYSFFGYFCHQSPSRSVTPYEVTFGIVQNSYTFPVCTRDLTFYLFFLLGAIAFPLTGKADTRDMPDLWLLVFAAVPMAIDGGTQLLGWRESTNTLRFITGAIIGFACAYYLIPLVNIIFSGASKKRGTIG